MAAVSDDALWLTYTEAAERLGVSASAVRTRAGKIDGATRIGPGGRSQVLASALGLGPTPGATGNLPEFPVGSPMPAGTATPAPEPTPPPEPWPPFAEVIELLATGLEGSAQALTEESGKLRAENKDVAADSGFITATIFGCLAGVLRVAFLEPVAEPAASERFDLQTQENHDV